MSLPAAAIILAGGNATRMGGEKALRVLRGRTLLDIAMETARAVCDELIVASGARTFSVPADVKLAPDDHAHRGKGPLAGVSAGLKLATHERVLVLACDLPHVTAQLAAALLDALAGADSAWCRHNADEPLFAALNRIPALAAVNTALAESRNKVMPVWQQLGGQPITGDALAKFGDPAHLFANVNTPEDLASA